jgi:hypothetical protein
MADVQIGAVEIFEVDSCAGLINVAPLRCATACGARKGYFFRTLRHDFAALDSLRSFRAKRSSHALLRVVRRHGMVVQAGRTAAVFIFTFANDATHGAPTVLMTTEFIRTENVGHAPLLGE